MNVSLGVAMCHGYIISIIIGVFFSGLMLRWELRRKKFVSSRGLIPPDKAECLAG